MAIHAITMALSSRQCLNNNDALQINPCLLRSSLGGFYITLCLHFSIVIVIIGNIRFRMRSIDDIDIDIFKSPYAKVDHWRISFHKWLYLCEFAVDINRLFKSITACS